MSKNKNTKPLHVRLGASSQRVREWAELTGKSENATAEFFAHAGMILIENPKPGDSYAAELRRQLEAMCEAQNLRNQAKGLLKRAAQVVSKAKA